VNGSPSIWPALLAFAAVIAMIPAVMWVIKRLQGGITTGAQGIQLRSGLALGPRERVAVIDVQGRRFLVGVTAQSVSLIAELEATEKAPGRAQDTSDATEPAPAMTPTANGFAELLTRLKRP